MLRLSATPSILLTLAWLLSATHLLAASPSDDAGPNHKQAWLTLQVQQDFPWLMGSDVCSAREQLQGGFSCFRSNGTQYHGTPQRGLGGKLDGGLTLGTNRGLLGAELGLVRNLTLGVRVGYAWLGAGPKSDGGDSFWPWHAELRGSYWSHPAGPAARKLVVFGHLGAGTAQIDGSINVPVVEDASAPPAANQLDNPPTQRLDAWKKLGSGFVALGGGAAIPLGEGVLGFGELRLLVLYPSSGAAMGLSLGCAFEL